MSFYDSLQSRRRRSERFKERYHGDPDYRLAWINAGRARRGAALLGSLDEVPAPHSWQRRGERGRFS